MSRAESICKIPFVASSDAMSAPFGAKSRQAWSDQLQRAENEGLCLLCLTYSGHTKGCCSTCSAFIESMPVSLEQLMSDFSPEELFHQASAKDEWRARQRLEDFSQTLSSLDKVSHILAMSPQMFEHFHRSLRSCETSPQKLAKQLLDFGNPLVTATQAKTLLDMLRSRGELDYRYYHVLCSRVVDPWNMKSSDHGIGHCYYGYMSISDLGSKQSLAKMIGSSERETLAAVFWRLLRSRVNFDDRGLPMWAGGVSGIFRGENFWSDQDLKLIRDVLHQHGLAEPMDVVITCQQSTVGHASRPAIVCSTMAGVECGRFEVPAGEAPLGPWLREPVIEAASRLAPTSGLGSRLCLVNHCGDIVWQQDAPGVLDAVCMKLEKTGIN